MPCGGKPLRRLALPARAPKRLPVVSHIGRLRREQSAERPPCGVFIMWGVCRLLGGLPPEPPHGAPSAPAGLLPARFASWLVLLRPHLPLRASARTVRAAAGARGGARPLELPAAPRSYRRSPPWASGRPHSLRSGRAVAAFAAVSFSAGLPPRKFSARAPALGLRFCRAAAAQKKAAGPPAFCAQLATARFRLPRFPPALGFTLQRALCSLRGVRLLASLVRGGLPPPHP